MGFGEIQLYYHIPWTSFKSVVHKEKLQCNLKEFMFHNSSIFMFPLKIIVQSEFVILIFQYSIHLLLIQFFFLVFIILKLSKLIPIVYQSPNSIEFE